MLFLTLSVLLALPLSAAYPKHSDYVSDKNEVLSANTVSALKDTNTRLQSGRGVVIAVCVTDSVGDEKLSDFSRNLFTQWKISNGVLLVVDTAAQDYYAVQCVDLNDILPDDKLTEILNSYMEPEFADGNIDRGVYKTILKLDEFLTAGLPARDNGNTAEIGNTENKDAQDTDEESKEEASGFVKVLKTIFTILLVLVILVVVLVGGLFVAALFNDTAMDLFQTYILGMIFGKNVTPTNRNTYDYEEDPYYDAPGKSAKTNRRTYDEYDDYYAPRQPARRQQPSYDNYNEPRRAPRQTPAQNGYYEDYSRQNYNRQNSSRQNYNRQNYNRQNYSRPNYNAQPARRQQPARNSGEGQYKVRNNPQQQYYDEYR